jgi:hypothetical protein
VAAFVELYWLPVGAGTSRFQQASLRLWEAIEAARARRPRQKLVHAALKIAAEDGIPHTLELMPAFVRADASPLITGPVGIRPAGRLRLFRYQFLCLRADRLPDEDFAFAAPVLLSEDPAAAARVLDLGHRVPRYTWGRRVPGTSEMWTSDSVVSWLLARAALTDPLAPLLPPPGTRAPGWQAGFQVIAAGRDFTP